MMNLSEIKKLNLLRLMADKHVNAAKLSRDCGLTPARISQLTTGADSIGDDSVVEKLAKALDCEPIEFYSLSHLVKDQDLTTDIGRLIFQMRQLYEGGDEFMRRSLWARLDDLREIMGRYGEKVDLNKEIEKLRKDMAEVQAAIGKVKPRKHQRAGSKTAERRR